MCYEFKIVCGIMSDHAVHKMIHMVVIANFQTIDL